MTQHNEMIRTMFAAAEKARELAGYAYTRARDAVRCAPSDGSDRTRSILDANNAAWTALVEADRALAEATNVMMRNR